MNYSPWQIWPYHRTFARYKRVYQRRTIYKFAYLLCIQWYQCKIEKVNFCENISIMLWTVMHSDNHYSLIVVKMGWISPFYSPEGQSWRDSVHQDGITSFLWNKTVKLFGRSGAGAMEFIKTDKPLWDRMLSSPPSPSWILPHIQWSIHWPIGNCLSPSSHGKMSLFTYGKLSVFTITREQMVTLHDHSLSQPVVLSIIIASFPSSTVKLINDVKSSLHILPSW